MLEKNSNIKFDELTDPSYAKEILEMMRNNLLTPEMLENFDENQINSYENNGFVIGDHSEETITQWINNEDQHIYVIYKDEGDRKNILGYIVLLFDSDIVNEVQDYCKTLYYEKEEYKQIVDKGNLGYLIQIAVKKDKHNKGLGSKLFKYVLDLQTKPIISFVIKNPILNRISLYAHLKAGFENFGEYYGGYGEFKDYKSIGLIYDPSKEVNDKLTTLEKMNQILAKNYS